jgi:putative phosphonate metabolism protein
MSERFAIYYAPETTDPLWRSACRWLGRDAASGDRLKGDTGIAANRLLALTEAARRYGFHATLRAPMRLAGGADFAALAEAARGFAASHRPVPLGALALADLYGFLALVPEQQSGELTEFAAACMRHFEPLRAPLSAEERERRRAGGGLTARHKALIDAFGYPYVLEQFRFHMTLTDRLDAADKAEIKSAASAWFEPFIGRDLLVDRISIFRESGPGRPFMRIEDFVLTGAE